MSLLRKEILRACFLDNALTLSSLKCLERHDYSADIFLMKALFHKYMEEFIFKYIQTLVIKQYSVKYLTENYCSFGVKQFLSGISFKYYCNELCSKL